MLFIVRSLVSSFIFLLATVFIFSFVNGAILSLSPSVSSYIFLLFVFYIILGLLFLYLFYKSTYKVLSSYISLIIVCLLLAFFSASTLFSGTAGIFVCEYIGLLVYSIFSIFASIFFIIKIYKSRK